MSASAPGANWSAFAPGPPPDLDMPEPSSAPASAAPRTVDPAQDDVSPPEPAAGQHPPPAIAPPRQSSRSSRQRRPAPAQVDSQTSEREPSRGSVKGAAALAAALAGLGLDVTVTSATRTPGGYAAALQLGADVIAEDLEPHAEALASALGVPSVRVSAVGDNGARLQTLHTRTASTRKVAVWSPAVVRDALDAALTPEQTRTTFVLTAFNRQYGKLGTFFAILEGLSGPMPGLAEGPPRPRRGLKDNVQFQLHLTPEQEAVLDAAVKSSGAPSRSALVTRILEEDLEIAGTPSR